MIQLCISGSFLAITKNRVATRVIAISHIYDILIVKEKEVGGVLQLKVTLHIVTDHCAYQIYHTAI